MTSSKLPIALVLPHGGLAIPPELHGRVALTDAQIFNEADAYIDDIFAFADAVLAYETFPYGRALLDMNRPADETDHHRLGDGVVKGITSYGQPVYLPGQEPDATLRRQLLASYWQSWQARLDAIEANPQIKLVIDCHSMAAVGPAYYDDPARLRPRVQVANLGDVHGEVHPDRGRLSAPTAVTRFFGAQLGELLADVPPLTAVGEEMAINEPFWGGWNLAVRGQAKQPWLMVELNRGLYVGWQNGDTAVVPPDPVRLGLLRQKVWRGLTAVVDYWLQHI